MELIFKFPIDSLTVISRLVITLGEKIIEAKIVSNWEAKEKYDDAVGTGKFGAILKPSDDQQLYEIYIGNLQPQ